MLVAAWCGAADSTLDSLPENCESIVSDFAEGWNEWPISCIHVSGLEVTDSVVVYRELEMRPGDVYTDQALVQDANNLNNTQLFARMVVTVSADSLNRSVVISYALRERPRVLLLPRLSPESNLGGWVYGVELRNKNLGGHGQQLKLKAKSGSSKTLQISWIDPWFLGRRLRLRLKADHREKHERRVVDGVSSDYLRKATFFSMRLQPFLNTQLSFFAEPAWFQQRSEDDDGERTTTNESGRDRFWAVQLGGQYNTTDIHINPGKGYRVLAGAWFFGLNGKKNPAGTLLELALSRFNKVGPIVIGSYVQLATLRGRRADYMKLTLGGHTLARGIESGAWPGWSRLITKLECRFPLLGKRILFQRYDLEITGVVFTDGAQSWQQGLERSAGFQSTIGAGLRFFVPFVDVLSADAAWHKDSGMQFYISTGQSF